MDKHNKKPTHISDRISMQPCYFGSRGFCCKNCLMGPCRLSTREQRGVCGATQDLIVARNILRFVAGGTAAHCGHAYHLLKYLGKEYPTDYIKKRAPRYLYILWNRLGLLPRVKHEHFRHISEALHLTTMGVNANYKDVLKWCLKLGIIDGYYGMYLATELEDQKFGKPKIKKGVLNLSVLDPDKTNVAVHGHEPMLAEALAKEAKKYSDVNLVGVCCTGASLLARHGIPLAANIILQEDVISTGIVEVMVVDVQCVMPSLADLCECYHTELITTNEIGKISGAFHMPIRDRKDAEKVAKCIITLARENRRHRSKDAEKRFRKMQRNKPKKVVVGFTEDNIGVRRIAKMIEQKKVRGVIGVIGCVNPRSPKEDWIRVFKELSKDYIIFTTGCVAFEFGANGLLDGKRFFHLGSCVNNARIAEIFKRIADYFGKRITDLPFLVSCPMPITEKSAAIGFFFAALGVDVHYGRPLLFSADDNIASYIAGVLGKAFESKIFLESLPSTFLKKIKREGLRYTFPK